MLRNNKRTVNILKYIMLIFLSFLLLFPAVFMLTNSMMTDKEVISTYSSDNVLDESSDVDSTSDNPATVGIKYSGFKLIPDEISFMQYYEVLLRKPRFLLMFWNSVLVTVPIVVGQIFVSSLAAFSFSKLRFPFRDKLFFVYIIVMMMPFQVTLVPNYIILKQMNLLGSYLAIILPGIFTTFGVFLLRQFMMFIPDEYCEAGKIDGAGIMNIFIRIILPQCKGAMASLAILVFVDNWNMVEQPLIFLKDETLHPLSVFLSKINEGNLGLAFACGILYMMPALLIFLYGENYLVEGIALSGIK